MQKDEQKACPFGDDIVSYMYDEMLTAGQLEFERHLAACKVCTDEFAAVSLARFEAYDWKRVEFDTLVTPGIVIPYPQKTLTFGERISAWMSWVTIVPAAAVLLVCIAVAYVLLIQTKNEGVIAEAPRVQDPGTIAPPAVADHEPRSADIASAVTKKTETQPVKAEQIALKRKSQIPRSTFARHAVPSVKFANDYAVNTTPSQLKPAPRLGMKDEEDDRSLRLADLFDETNPPPQR